MAWSAVSSAVTRIGELLAEEAIYLWGVEEQVDLLQRELQWMQSFLIDAETNKGESEGVRLWVAEIRDLAYDAEDIVEGFALRIGSKRKGGFSKVIRRSTCILKDGQMLHETRSKIERIIARITDLTRRLQTYGIKELRIGEGSSSFDQRRELRRSYPHIIEDNVVGMFDDIKKIVSVLVEEESHCRVVSISGMVGLGKTTLAKKVYHHRQIRGHFDHLAWVYVSQQCQKRKVWEDILSGLRSSKEKGSKLTDDEKGSKPTDDERGSKPSDDSKLSVGELANTLSEFLKDKKCLVILDDVWKDQDWDSVSPALPTGETSSKILLTSRNTEVASHADRYLHNMEYLKENHSWELFQNIVFPTRDSPDYRVDSEEQLAKEKLGKQMIEHCGGLPLAIIVLGGILATKNSLDDWEKVSKNVSSYLKRDKDQGIEHVLALSYDDLPPYLRPCFLYLSHFPEDCKIDADRLIQLWMAEGFVFSKDDERNEGETMEDVAESYLVKLVERFMIQVEERDASLRIKTCRMHDVMRELCLSKAKQENFLYVIDHSNSFQSTKNFSPSISRTVRRIVEHEYTPVQGIRRFHLRSILFFCDLVDVDVIAEAILNPKILKYWEEHDMDECRNRLLGCILVIFLLCKVQGFWTYMFNNFKLLRVLDFEKGADITGIKLPSAIGNLIHLRFLSLRCLEFIWPKLPSSLGNLRCLQTLDLRVWGGLVCLLSVYVPNVIWKLKQLRHLYLPQRCNRKTKLKLHTLTNLQTLVNFNTKNSSVADLSNMANLRKLVMFIEALKEDLGKKLKSKYIRSFSIESNGAIDTRNVALTLSSLPSTTCKLTLSTKIGKLPFKYRLYPLAPVQP